MKYLKLLFKNFAQIISVFSFLILCWGYFSLSIAYSEYGIDINHYVGVTEIIILSLRYVSTNFWFLLVQGIFLGGIIMSLYQSLKNGISKFKWFKKKLLNGTLTVVLIFAFGMLANKLSGIPIYGKGIDLLFLQIVICFIGFLLTLALFDTRDTKDSQHVVLKVLIILFIQGCLITVTFPISAELSLHNKNYSKAEFLIKDSLLISTSDTVEFIGNTTNYYFFYNSKRKNTTVYPASAISKIEYENVNPNN